MIGAVQRGRDGALGLLVAAMTACGGGGGGSSEPLPTIPAGMLRDPSAWAFVPRPGRDVECALGTDCGRSFVNVLAWAARWDEPGLFPDLTETVDVNSDHDVVTLACALAWRGTEEEAWRERARLLLEVAVSTPYSPTGVSALRPGRNLLSYVLAADTIELAALDPVLDGAFRVWIEQIAEFDVYSGDGVTAGTFRTYHEQRPNNVGVVVGAARVAVDMYLGGPVHARHLNDAARVLRGYLGDRSAYVFPRGAFGGGGEDDSWQADRARPIGVGAPGARIAGLDLDVDGCLPEEMRRLGALDCLACGAVPSVACYNRADALDGGLPPGISATNYPWEALQGLVMQAYLLWRCGFDCFAWEDAAIERTHRFLYVTYGIRAQDTWSDPTQGDDPGCCDGVSNRAQVDDTWVPHVVACLYGSSFLEGELVYGGKPGKNCGFADWWMLGVTPPSPPQR